MNIKKFVVAVSVFVVLVAGSVASVGAMTPIHDSGFTAVYAAGQIKTNVSALDALNRPVSGAAVQISFEKQEGPTILRSGLTSKAGLAAISAKVTSGSWQVCVEEIHKAGFDYSPLQNTCTSVLVP